MKVKIKNPRMIILIVIAIIVIIAAVFAAVRRSGGPAAESGSNSVIPVVTVQDLMNPGAGSDMVNRFAGVVETQDSWSVNQNQEVEVKELFVREGQEVKKGDPLFAYDTDKYESDLEQAKIDLERLKNELTSIGETIDQLAKDKANASSSEQAAYTIQIQEQELAQKQKDLDIRSKEAEIAKLEDNIKNATVSSGIDGVVQSIRSGQNQNMYGNGEPQAFITVMKVGDYRIKGTVNEQNFAQIQEGAPVLVYSRVDESQVWKGTISRIDIENPDNSGSSMYYGDNSNASSKYPFYVELENSEGLIMGQHVYMQVDYGQEDLSGREGIWLPAYYVDETDPENPFVWADDGSGHLKKRSVQPGERDDELYLVQITEGLEMTDAVAVPDPELTEGMPTAQM